ncbi:hypothetical protein V8E36_000808 [Tilletia maclaganii]
MPVPSSAQCKSPVRQRTRWSRPDSTVPTPEVPATRRCLLVVNNGWIRKHDADAAHKEWRMAADRFDTPTWTNPCGARRSRRIHAVHPRMKAKPRQDAHTFIIHQASGTNAHSSPIHHPPPPPSLSLSTRIPPAACHLPHGPRPHDPRPQASGTTLLLCPLLTAFPSLSSLLHSHAMRSPTSSRFLLLCLAAVGLFGFASASPFGVADESELDHIARFGRAGTTPAGQACYSSSECISGNCVGVQQGESATVSGTCQRQPTGGPCKGAANCASYNCVQGKCTTPSKLYGTCSNTTKCSSGLQCTSTGICRYVEGQKCSSNKQCALKNCANGVCGAGLGLPNSQCKENEDCATGSCRQCHNYAYYSLDSNGTVNTCPQNPSSYPGYPEWTSDANICTRYPLGHSCQNQGECEVGLCRNGKCTANGLGAACAIDAQCSDLGALCRNGTCYAPAKGSGYPSAECGSDDQCVSGRCVSGIAPKDSQGVNNGIVTKQPTKRYLEEFGSRTCDYLQENATGCRSLFDCAFQLCKNSKCVFGSVGDKCTINYQCASKVCSTGGKCINPGPGANRTYGLPCSQHNQCWSGSCQTYLGSPPDKVRRPSLGNSSLYVKEYDFTCEKSYFGRPCNTPTDCLYYKAACMNGVCVNPDAK